MDNNLVNDIDKARKLNRMACEDIDKGELDFAAEKLTEAIRLAPNLAEPHTNLGVSLFRCCLCMARSTWGRIKNTVIGEFYGKNTEHSTDSCRRSRIW